MTKTKASNAQPLVKNSTFIGVQYDAKAVDAISSIATGLIENAKALGSLSQVLRSSNVSIDALLKIGQKEGK